MMEITMRPYAGVADQEAVLDLLRVCRAASRERTWPDVAELRVSLLGSPTLDPTQDARLWEDAAGQVCGFATGSRNTTTQALLASVGYHLAHRVLAYAREV